MRRCHRNRTFLVAFTAIWFTLFVAFASSFCGSIRWRNGPYDRFGIDAGRAFVVVDWWGGGFELTNVFEKPNGWRFDVPIFMQHPAALFWPHRHAFWGGTLLSFPLWIPLALLAASIAYGSFKLRRQAPGACACGYDLRGNMSGRCPECGAPVAECSALRSAAGPTE